MSAAETVTQKEFAELIGVASRTMLNLRNAGLSEFCEVRGNTVMVRVAEGFQWYVRYREGVAADSPEQKSLAQAELELAVTKAESARLDLERKKARLIEVAKIDPWVADLFARLRARLDALDVRIAQNVTAETLPERRREARALIDEVIEELRGTPLDGLDDGEEMAAA